MQPAHDRLSLLRDCRHRLRQRFLKTLQTSPCALCVTLRDQQLTTRFCINSPDAHSKYASCCSILDTSDISVSGPSILDWIASSNSP